MNITPPTASIGPQVSFRSEFTVVGRIPSFDQQALSQEPQLAYCSVPWTRANGGPIANAFLDALPAGTLADASLRIGLEVAWLRKGWSRGGVSWHLDRVAPRPDGQPDYPHGRGVEFRRFCCSLGGNAPTRMLVGEVIFPDYAIGQSSHLQVHAAAEAGIAAGRLTVTTVTEGEIFCLTGNSFHSASEASHDAFRLFVHADCSIEGFETGEPGNAVQWEVRNSFRPRTMEEGLRARPYLRAGHLD